MASSERTEATVSLPTVGEEGDVCAQCGSALAVDQRYCINCGLRRADNRVDYQRQLAANGAQPTAGGGAATASAGAPGQWTPIWAIGAIAVLGIMLLLGVLIGNDNDDPQVVTGAAAPAASTPTEPTPTETTAAAPVAPKADAAATAPGAGNVVQGGTGDTEGIAAADTSQQGGGSVQENAKSGPDVVATEGEREQLDPSGQAGGGSSATCIGC
jgi:hypothetical protein